MKRIGVIVTLACSLVLGQGNVLEYKSYEDMPDWAVVVINGSDPAKTPKDADVWRLLDEHEVIYAGESEVIHRRRIVQTVLRQGGARSASYHVAFGDLEEGKIMKLTGWHRPLLRQPERIKMKDLVMFGNSRVDALNQSTQMVGLFEDVRKGSVIAFDVVIRHKTMLGATKRIGVMGPFPVASFVVTAKRKSEVLDTVKSETDAHLEKRIEPFGFKKWQLEAETGSSFLRINNVPAMRNEPFQAQQGTFYPNVLVSFVDPGEEWQYQSWDHFARWYFKIFNKALGSEVNVPVTGDRLTLKHVEGLVANMKKITYKQVYLSAGRGWTPSSGEEVKRRAWGDCKDMVACLADYGIKQNLRVLPVLANIGPGSYYSEKDRPYSNFNHLIGALELEASLGLPAELMVGDKRYLIMDPTSPHTRLGYLPSHYKGRDLLICDEKGASWVSIPNSALEQGSLTMALSGDVDESFTLVGELRVTEVGNDAGMRSVMRNAGDRALIYQLRYVLGFSGVVELELLSKEIDSSGRALTTWRIQWPGFMRHDSGGVRLSEVVLPRFRSDILGPGRKRTSPIAFPEKNGLKWEINVNTPFSVAAGAASQAWRGDHQAFAWEVDTSSGLQLDLKMDLQGSVFERHRLKAGVTAWREFSKAYQRFYLFDSLFSMDPG